MRDFDDLLPAFAEESLQHLKNIKENITTMEGEQEHADMKQFNRVFRGLHSIKGGASFLGLKNIEKLSHLMEDILNMVKNGEVEFTAKLADCILKGIEKLEEMLNGSGDSGQYNIDLNQYLKELEDCLESKPVDKTVEKIKMTIEDSYVKVDKEKLDSLRKQGKKVYLIQFELKDESLGGSNLLDLFNEIEKAGEIVARNVDMELVLRNHNFSGEGLPLSILYASVLEKDYVAMIFDVKEDIVKEVKPNSLIEEEIVGDVLIHTGEKKKGYLRNVDVESYFIHPGEREKAYPEGADGTLQPGHREPVETGEHTDQEREFLTFFVAEKIYGIAVTQVLKVVSLDEITPVPFEKDFIKGVFNLKGEILPVYDFRLKMNLEERQYDKETVILIVMFPGTGDGAHDKKAGIIVDRVSEIIRLEREEITNNTTTQDIPAKYIHGVGKKTGTSIILLKLKEMFGTGRK